MKTYQVEVSRSLSVEPDHKSSVNSILKDPSKSKLKHNRSVRFLEPEDDSSEESLESRSVCQQQTKETAHPVRLNVVNDFIRINKRESCLNTLFQPSKPNPSTSKKKEEVKVIKNTEKIINKANSKQKKNFHSSASPKFEPKVINFEFRDKSFYAKLNKFISTKTCSPEKTQKTKVTSQRKTGIF
jgi:hypothetical protein